MIVYERRAGEPTSAVAKLINRTDDEISFRIPAVDAIGDWRVAFSTSDQTVLSERKATMPALSVALLAAD